MPEPGDWHLDDDYHARIFEWAGQANPHPALLQRVHDWFPTIELDPYHHAFAKPGEAKDDLYYREVPDAVTDGLTVVVSYSIDARRRIIRCHLIELRDDPPRPEHLH